MIVNSIEVSDDTIGTQREHQPKVFTTGVSKTDKAISLSIPLSAFKQMTVSDLRNLADCTRTISNVIAGLMSQPRFNAQEGYTEAGDVLDYLTDFVNWLSTSAIVQIAECKTANLTEAYDKLYALLAERSLFDCSISDILEIVVKGLRDIEIFESVSAAKSQAERRAQS